MREYVEIEGTLEEVQFSTSVRRGEVIQVCNVIAYVAPNDPPGPLLKVYGTIRRQPDDHISMILLAQTLIGEKVLVRGRAEVNALGVIVPNDDGDFVVYGGPEYYDPIDDGSIIPIPRG